MLELSGRDFKAVTIKWFQQVIMKSLETYEEIENLIKEIEVTKKNQVEIIELKSTATKTKKEKRKKPHWMS